MFNFNLSVKIYRSIVTEEDNIIKITDGKLANELLDIMYDEHMNPRGSDIRISH